MTQAELQLMQKEIEDIKNDVAVIKHILSEEGVLTASAKQRLEKARKTPDHAYRALY